MFQVDRKARSRTSRGLIPDIGLITARRAEETGTNSSRMMGEGACGSSIHFPSEARARSSADRERREKGGRKMRKCEKAV